MTDRRSGGPHARAASGGRHSRTVRGLARFVAPLACSIGGVVLVAVSVTLVVHNRALPADFGQIPQSVAGRPLAEIPLSSPTASAHALSTTSTFISVQRNPTSSRNPQLLRPVPVQQVSGVRPGAASARRALPGAGRVRLTPATSTGGTKAAAAPQTVVPSGVPKQLILPRLGVRAAVQPVVSRRGVLAVPDDPGRVGWWVGSSAPGKPQGTTVIDGHIDSATAGVGAFWHLSALAAGDSVNVVTSTGATVRYRVLARRVYPKSAGLPSTLFTLTGPPMLLLISCGGPFDADSGSYQDNIAVFAVPTSAP